MPLSRPLCVPRSVTPRAGTAPCGVMSRQPATMVNAGSAALECPAAPGQNGDYDGRTSTTQRERGCLGRRRGCVRQRGGRRRLRRRTPVAPRHPARVGRGRARGLGHSACGAWRTTNAPDARGVLLDPRGEPPHLSALHAGPRAGRPTGSSCRPSARSRSSTPTRSPPKRTGLPPVSACSSIPSC
jgi:hypothetical protein